VADGTISIRPATTTDTVAIAAVHVASIRGLPASHYSAAQIASWSAGKHPQVYERALENGEVMLVAVVDDAVVGFGSRHQDEIRAVYVDPSHTRRGIGQKLLVALELDALAHGETALRLDASLNAVVFYAAQGYRKHEQAVHVLRAGGELQCVRMSKTL
jgi:putative acetyltransferase